MGGQELAMSSMTARKKKEVVVFIDGLFGGGVAGSARKALAQRFPSARFVTLHCGAVSSVRDRAVECFYQLKGGQTDYAVANPTLETGHGRYGLKYPGIHPEWDETQPIHIIAYSLGAPTARFLQHLLIRQAFTNEDGDHMRSSGAWVASISTLNGVNNGTVAVYAVGLSPISRQPLPFSILWWIFSLIYVAVWCEWECAEKSWKLQLGHWAVRKEHGVSLLKLMSWRPGAADNGGRDLCPASIAHLNAEMETTLPHPATRYLACCASCTAPLPLAGVEIPTLSLLAQALFLAPLSLVVSITAYLHALLRFCLASALAILSLLPLPRSAALSGKESRDQGKGSAVVASKGAKPEPKKEWGVFGRDTRCACAGAGVQCSGAWSERLQVEQANDGVCSVHCQAAPAADARRGLGARHCCLNSLVQGGVASGTWTECQMPNGFSHVELCQGTQRAEAFLGGLCTLILQKKVDLGGDSDPEEAEEVGGAEKIKSIRQKLDRHEKWVGKVLDKSKSPVKRSPSKAGSSPN